MSWQELKSRWEQQPEYREAVERELPYRDISAAVVGWRVEHGLTQRELAERADTTQSVISRLESGKHSVEISLLSRIAKALNSTWHPVFEPMAARETGIVINSQAIPSSPYLVELRVAADRRLTVYTGYDSEQPGFSRVVETNTPDHSEPGKAVSA
jgi:transcriptional regulator with XRE-family HTH domain